MYLLKIASKYKHNRRLYSFRTFKSHWKICLKVDCTRISYSRRRIYKNWYKMLHTHWRIYSTTKCHIRTSALRMFFMMMGFLSYCPTNLLLNLDIKGSLLLPDNISKPLSPHQTQPHKNSSSPSPRKWLSPTAANKQTF